MATMDQSFEAEEEKRWEDESISPPSAEKDQQVTQGSVNLTPPPANGLGAELGVLLSSPLSPSSAQALWSVLQQKLFNARQQIILAQETWKTAMLQRQQLDVIFNGPTPMSDDEYDSERKNKALQIQKALQAVLEATNQERSIEGQLVLLSQLSSTTNQPG